MIGDDISITVLGSKGNQVRIGVEAPKNVEVHREEIYRKIKEQESNDSRLQSCTTSAYTCMAS